MASNKTEDMYSTKLQIRQISSNSSIIVEDNVVYENSAKLTYKQFSSFLDRAHLYFVVWSKHDYLATVVQLPHNLSPDNKYKQNHGKKNTVMRWLPLKYKLALTDYIKWEPLYM